MIFNHCIYGNINRAVGKLILHYYNYSLEETISKEIILESGTYQFNLGDRALLDINSVIKDGDIVLLEYFDDTDTKGFSDKCILDLTNNIQEFNINVGTTFSETSEEANFLLSEQLVKTSSYKLSEIQTDLYNYFKVIDIDEVDVDLNPIVKYEGNKEEFYFIPTQSHKYKIFEKSINKTSNVITEKEYEFNAIVGSAAITRSNKCKSINDSIKIIFQGFDTSLVPEMKVVRDDTELETGVLRADGNNLYSYNFTFPSTGYFLFAITYGDEVFLVDFRVGQRDFKIYYSDEHHESGLSLGYEYFSISDMSASLGIGVLNDIGDGLYSSDLLGIEYGDYIFRINDDDFITSFEECGATSTDENNNPGGANSLGEEVYWIFPNNIGD